MIGLRYWIVNNEGSKKKKQSVHRNYIGLETLLSEETKECLALKPKATFEPVFYSLL